jgi:hypothetical protein
MMVDYYVFRNECVTVLLWEGYGDMTIPIHLNTGCVPAG